jgi:hypothetical protein
MERIGYASLWLTGWGRLVVAVALCRRVGNKRLGVSEATTVWETKGALAAPSSHPKRSVLVHPAKILLLFGVSPDLGWPAIL